MFLPAKIFQRSSLSIIHIDMLEYQKGRLSKGLFVFAIGLISLILSLSLFFYIKNKTTLQEDAVVQVKSVRTVIAPMDLEESKKIKEATGQLNIPWDKLFVALESVSSDSARIISVEPDPLKYTFTIVAESESLKEMMTYVNALSTQQSLRNVHLILQQTVIDGKKESIEFVVEGNWVAL